MTRSELVVVCDRVFGGPSGYVPCHPSDPAVHRLHPHLVRDFETIARQCKTLLNSMWEPSLPTHIALAVPEVQAALIPGSELTAEASTAAWTLAKEYLKAIEEGRISYPKEN